MLGAIGANAGVNTRFTPTPTPVGANLVFALLVFALLVFALLAPARCHGAGHAH